MIDHDSKRDSRHPALRPSRHDAGWDRALMIPPVTLAFMVIVLAGAASLSIPIHHIAGGLEILLGIAWLGWILRWRRRPLLPLMLLAVLAAGLTMAYSSGRLLPAPDDVFVREPDAWSYNALADYLDKYPRGKTAGMSMVDEFGSHLYQSRFGAPTLLAFLQELPPLRDAASSAFAFGLICLVVHFFSMLLIARALFEGGWLAPLASALAATSAGWASKALDLANYDNLLFIALAPALLSVLFSLTRAGAPSRPLTWRPVLLGAILLASLLYAYAEGTALLILIAAPFLIAAGLASLRDAGLRFQLIAIVVGGLLLASPYLRIEIGFLQRQISAGLNAASIRPGEGTIPGLLNDHWFPALFALGEEFKGSTYRWYNNITPLILSALTVMGGIELQRRRRWFPALFLSTGLLLAWQAVAARYDYGSYKILICSGWWIYPAIVAGFAGVARRSAWGAGVWPCLACALVMLVGVERYEDRRSEGFGPGHARLTALRQLRELPHITGGAPLLLNLDDDFDHLWATYYLRDQPLVVVAQRNYLAMPHIQPFLAQGLKVNKDDCRYQLVQGTDKAARWSNGRFSLVPRREVYISAVDNPNGVEQTVGERLMWLGSQPATLHVFAAKAGDYELRAEAFSPGPSVPGKTDRDLEISDDAGVRTVKVTPQTRSIPLRLRTGDNLVRLRCLDKPIQNLALSHVDPRELVLMMRGFQVTTLAQE